MNYLIIIFIINYHNYHYYVIHDYFIFHDYNFYVNDYLIFHDYNFNVNDVHVNINAYLKLYHDVKNVYNIKILN